MRHNFRHQITFVRIVFRLLAVFGTFYFHSTQKVDSLMALLKTSGAYSKYSDKELMKIWTDAYKLFKKLNYPEGTLNAI